MNRKIPIIFSLLWAAAFFAFADARAEELEVLSPDTGDRVVEELQPDESAELVIYLKSFGDLVGGYTVKVLDDQARQVGKTVSDMFGVAKFTNMPAGRFRIIVERRTNERGGASTVSVGDLRITKIRK